MRIAPSVSLRAVQEGDRARLLTWRNLPEVARWMYNDHLISAEEHDRWFATALIDPRRSYWIIEVEEEPVGLANLYDIDRANRKAAWAYYLGEASTRGKGIGAFVEYWVIEHVFGLLQLGKLWCEVLTENTGVVKLHEAFGFQREALFRSHVVKAGQPMDVVGLGLLADDWAAARPAAMARLQKLGFDLPS